MIEYIGKIQTKSSVVLGLYTPNTHSHYTFSYPGELQKGELPVFYGEFRLQNYSDIYLQGIEENSCKSFDGEDRVSIFTYINNGEFEVLGLEVVKGLIFRGYFTVSISGGQRYIKPILRKDLTDILDKVI